MRSVEEIKAEIKRANLCVEITCDSSYTCDGCKAINMHNLGRLEDELRAALTASIPLYRLESLCAAEREGRCVVLPCKVGDEVWVVDDGKVVGTTVTDVTLDSLDEMAMRVFVDGRPIREVRGIASNAWTSCRRIFCFGADLFLTRAEAEAALRQKGATDDI